jgi:hypothetical protein
MSVRRWAYIALGLIVLCGLGLTAGVLPREASARGLPTLHTRYSTNLFNFDVEVSVPLTTATPFATYTATPSTPTTPGPDLRPQITYSPGGCSGPGFGQLMTFEADSGDAGPSTMRLQKPGGQQQDFPVPAIPSGGHYSVNCNTCFSSSPITLTVDIFNTVVETNENNNVTTWTYVPPFGSHTPCPPTSPPTLTRTPTVPTATATSTGQATATPSCQTAWQLIPSISHGTDLTRLAGVAVVSPDDVWAVGSYNNSSTSGTYIIHWNGQEWNTVPSPNPGNNAYGIGLNGVTAISANDVWAVGSYFIQTGEFEFFEHWNGTEWSFVPGPHPGIDARLEAIFATSGSDIWAVGTYQFISMSPSQTLIERYNGTSWTRVPSPNIGSNPNGLYGISALSANDAWAVGFYYDESASMLKTLALRWDGTQWSVVPTPNGGTGSGILYGVTAISPNNAWAVGSSNASSTGSILIMHWDGSVWSMVPGPAGVAGYAYAVSALSANDIWAVGGYLNTKGRTQPLTIHWDGSAWSRVSSPIPDPQLDSAFYSVDALTSDYVWAVGIYNRNTLTMRYSAPCGTPTPSPSPSTPVATSSPTASRTITTTAVATSITEATSTFTATPVQTTGTPTPCAVSFTDLPPSSTFYASVRCLACRGILGGYSNGTFRPNNDITRGQLSKIVANSAGLNEPVSGQTFQDVPVGSTFYTYIERMARRGIVGGYPCGTVPYEPCGTSNKPYFRPGAHATRGQISKIVSNAKGYNDPPGEQIFEDVPPGSTFYEWVQRLASRGIIGGYPCGGPGEPCGVGNRPYFRPNKNATRGQVSKMVANTFFPGCQTQLQP